MAKLDGILTRVNGDTRDDLRALIEKIGTIAPKNDDISNQELAAFVGKGFQATGKAVDQVVKSLDRGSDFKDLKASVKKLDSSLKDVLKRIESIPQPDNKDVLQSIQEASEDIKKAVSAVSDLELDLTPLVDAIEMLAKRKPELSKEALEMLQRDDEEWVFDVEREDFSDRIKTITARKVS